MLTANVRQSGGFVPIPNSIIENCSRLSHAELMLALIVIRRNNGHTNTMPISDDNWQRWSGLTPRMKEHAAKLLQGKGLIVSGRGAKAVYSWRPDDWESFVVAAALPSAAKEKKAKPVKALRLVHPDCEGTCYLRRMEEPAAAGGLQLVKPAAAPAIAAAAAAPAFDAGADAWPLTLAAVRSVFPTVGAVFPRRLAMAVHIKGLTDELLAEAVMIAWRNKHGTQTSEGLFFYTVPEVVIALRRERSKRPKIKCTICVDTGLINSGVFPDLEKFPETDEGDRQFKIAMDEYEASKVACKCQTISGAFAGGERVT